MIVYRQLRAQKYRNEKVRLDGFVFASKKEASRFVELRMRQKMGEISGLTVHPRFDLIVNGEKVGVYVADFLYFVCHNDIRGSCKVVEDTKGYRTRDFILKKKLMKAALGIDVKEI